MCEYDLEPQENLDAEDDDWEDTDDYDEIESHRPWYSLLVDDDEEFETEDIIGSDDPVADSWTEEFVK